MRTFALLLSLCLVALLPGFAQAQEALQPQAPPETGAWTLAPGFAPDPMRVPALIGGGDIDAVQRQLGADCAGFITAEPDVRLTLEQPIPLLNLAFVADALTTDTTLIVYAPDGTFHCNNNSSPGLFNPMVTLNPALAGDYAIWVGGFTPGVAVYGELFVTTRADAQPGSTGLVLPIATTVPTPVPAGMTTPTPVPGTFLNPALPAAHATVTLAHGFLPDPNWTIVIGGGELAVPPLDTGRADTTVCAGYATSEPDVRLNWSGESPGLRFHVLPTTDGVDAALVVRTPDGRWLCNAEFAPGFTDPSVEVADPPEGEYTVWAANQAGPNTRYVAGLVITEINSTPGTLNPPGSTALPFVAGLDPGAAAAPIAFSQDTPDPLALTAPMGFTPGTVDLAALNPPPEGSNTPTCPGFTTAAPTISIDLTFPYPWLRVFFVGAEGTDATLVLHMPDGRWFCVDDSPNSKHPLIDVIGPPVSGIAQIWVGSFSAQETGVMGTLYVTRGSASPSAPTLSAPFTGLTEINTAPPAAEAQVFPTALPALTTGPLTPDAVPNYGSVTLSSATPPHTVQVIGGGDQDASKAQEGCVGVVSAQPDFVVDWQGAAGPLRVFFVGEGDATLAVLGPDGVIQCNDDSFNSVMPTVDIATAQSGAYRIWVGSFDAGTTAPGTLFITDDLSHSPVSP